MNSATTAGRAPPSISNSHSVVMRVPAPVRSAAFKRLMQAQARSHWHRRRVAHAVRAVVEPLAAPLDTPDPALQRRHERQHEQSMRDGLPAGHLAGCPLGVDMNPEVVAGELREAVDVMLLDGEPVAAAEALADEVEEFGRGLQDEHGPAV